MATIKHKRGTSDPSTSDVAVGELAINTTDGGLFTQTDGGSVVEIGSGGGFEQDSQGNLVAGTNAGDDFSGTSAEDNILIGENAGTAIDTGDRNIAIGTDAIKINSGQGDNVAVGYEALKNVTRFPHGSGGAFSWYGQKNVAIGTQALSGGQSMTGYNNVAIGYQALKLNTEGYTCVAIGSNALENNISRGNTACGTNALKSLNVNYAKYNTAIGEGAGQDSTTGYQNLFAGWAAGNDVTSGINNVVLGYNAAHSGTNNLTSGSNNIIIGYQAEASSQTVSNEVTIGDTSITKFRVPGLNFVVKDSTATEDYVLTVDANGEAGWEAAAGGGVTVQDEGTALSTDATALNFTGSYVTATGTGATKGISIYAHSVGSLTRGGTSAGSAGTGSTFFGYHCGKNATSSAHGDRNTAFGSEAFKLGSNWGGDNNVAVGWYAAYYARSDSNTVVGTAASADLVSGGLNTCIGQNAGRFSTSGAENTFLGASAGQAVTSGSDNVAVGRNAGNSGTNNLTSGSNNILIGHDAAASAGTVSNEITLGDANITKFRIPGINVVLKDNGGTPTAGHVLTVDSNGEAEFAAAAGGGPTGGGSDEIFTENDQTMTTDYTITNNKNAMAAGPITINNGVTLTIGAGETVTIV